MKTIALMVIARLTNERNATKVVVGKLTSMANVVPADNRCTPAHINVRPLNNRVTAGRQLTSESSGQKSEAIRAIIGVPNRSDARNTSASTRVVATGCRKYMNVPLSRPTTVRTVRPATASCSTPGTLWRVSSRRNTEPYAQPSAAHIPAAGPTVTKKTYNRIEGMTVASISAGSDRRPTMRKTRSFEIGVRPAETSSEPPATSIARWPGAPPLSTSSPPMSPPIPARALTARPGRVVVSVASSSSPLGANVRTG